MLAAQPRRVFTAAELARALERSGLVLEPQADRMVFEAMRKAVYRGWVEKPGRGRYRFGAVPNTTLRRIRRWREGLELGLNGPQRSAYASWHRTTQYGEPVTVPPSRAA